jgi:EF hand domain-containing protein
MFFLAGAAASDALGLISSLQQALGGNNASGQSPTPFDPASMFGASGGAQTSATPSANGAPAAPLSSSTLNALFSMQGQDGQPLMMVNGDALSQQMFSLLDGNGDGAVSQSEFAAAFGQNGHATQADSLFAQIDTNGDGSISLQELTNALEGQDPAQGQGQGQGDVQGMEGHHHHHHGGGIDIASLLGGASSDGGAGGAAGGGDGMGIGANAGLGANLTGDATQTVTNSDGSTTTTITYADGSQVTMTIPGANSSSQNGSSAAPSAAMLNNFVEQMIQRQAQLLASTSVGQSLAVSA